MYKYALFTLMSLLIIGGILTTKPVYAQDWYPGDGAKQGLLIKYRISNFDYKKGTPFDATLWFGSQDDKGNWITDIIVEEKGKVSSGVFKLSSLTLTPLGTDIPPELKPYREPIKNSLAWLGSYSSKVAPESLSGNSVWGVIAAIGGGSITVRPFGTETIQAGGQSWDTHIIGWHYGEDSKVWVKQGFPLPIKAKVFALVTQKPIPTQFEFELLETRITETRPEPPKQQIELPMPPLSQVTTTAKFNVDLYWEPIEIQPDEPTEFTVVIYNAHKKIMRNIMYILKIVDAEGNTVIDKKFTALDGKRTHSLILEETGPLSVSIRVFGSPESIAGDIAAVEFIETVNFELVVVPEFPLGFSVVIASMVALMVLMTKFKKIIIPKL